jgi:uncharacterized membrane protein (UPF0127 family)
MRTAELREPGVSNPGGNFVPFGEEPFFLLFFTVLFARLNRREQMRCNETGRRSRFFSLAAMTVMIAFFVVSCSAQSAASQDPDKPNPPLKTVTLKAGNIQVIAEVAVTELEKNRGLKFRKTLAEGKGMLFVFESDQKVSFWMKNTALPLSLAFISSDGTILQILDLQPFSVEPRPSERSVRYALEVPQGWFAKVGLKVGDHFEIPKLG